MSEIILVRHGQANSAATDEVSYDRLSDLGKMQAMWLGEWMAATDPHFDRIYTGTLMRQRQTISAMGFSATGEDARLNELTYFALAHAMEVQHGVKAPDAAHDFANYLPEVIAHWAEDRLAGVPETFGSFHARIMALIHEVAAQQGRSMLVTSGGVIGMVMRHVLNLDTAAMTQMMLRTHNSSIHRLRHVHGRMVLDSFNATPHLASVERAHARTFI